MIQDADDVRNYGYQKGKFFERLNRDRHGEVREVEEREARVKFKELLAAMNLGWAGTLFEFVTASFDRESVVCHKTDSETYMFMFRGMDGVTTTNFNFYSEADNGPSGLAMNCDRMNGSGDGRTSLYFPRDRRFLVGESRMGEEHAYFRVASKE